jgi:hypothetical protein
LNKTSLTRALIFGMSAINAAEVADAVGLKEYVVVTTEEQIANVDLGKISTETYFTTDFSGHPSYEHVKATLQDNGMIANVRMLLMPAPVEAEALKVTAVVDLVDTEFTGMPTPKKV